MDDYARVAREYEILVWGRDLVGLHAGELHVVEFCACPGGEFECVAWVLVQATDTDLRVVSSIPDTDVPLRSFFPGAAREAVRRHREVSGETGEH